MKAIILAAGYGTRLEKDLQLDTSGAYDYLRNVPKALLPIGPYEEPLITHLVRSLKQCEDVDGIYVVTNAANHEQFVQWSSVECPDIVLIRESSTNNETRIGAVACLALAIDNINSNDDVIVIAGDTLFYDDFSLNKLISQFREIQGRDPNANMLLYVSCSDEDVHKYGILDTDSSGIVVGFLEKPLPTETSSRKECPCFYFLSRHSLALVHTFLKSKADEPLKARDATGNFIAYLITRQPVFATEISGRFDVGGLEAYLQCRGYFLEKHGSIDFS